MWFRKKHKVEDGDPQPIRITDTHLSIVRPEGSERPIGRILLSTRWSADRDAFILEFDGFMMQIVGAREVLTQEM